MSSHDFSVVVCRKIVSVCTARVYSSSGVTIIFYSNLHLRVWQSVVRFPNRDTSIFSTISIKNGWSHFLYMKVNVTIQNVSFALRTRSRTCSQTFTFSSIGIRARSNIQDSARQKEQWTSAQCREHQFISTWHFRYEHDQIFHLYRCIENFPFSISEYSYLNWHSSP